MCACMYSLIYVCIHVKKIPKKIKRMISSKVSIIVPSRKKQGDNIKHADINL